MSLRRHRTTLSRRATTLLTTAALLAGSGVLVGSGFASGTTTAAPAAPCDDVPYANSSSAVEVFRGGFNLKTRPAAECGNVARADEGDVFYAWCYHVNRYGNLWAYGRLKGTQTRGWESVGNLAHRAGTTNFC